MSDPTSPSAAAPRDPVAALFLDRAAVGFASGALPPRIGRALARCRGLAPSAELDAAVFLANAIRANDGPPSEATTRGLADWLTALGKRGDVVRSLWTSHRGTVLYILESVSGSAAVWALAEAADARERLIDLALREARMGVPDRLGTSFLVTERTAGALGDALGAVETDPRGSSDLLQKAASWLTRAAALDWSDVRAWAAGLREHAFHVPGELAARRSASAPAASDPLDEVPFGALCARPAAPLVVDLARQFARATVSDVRLYDRAPLAVLSIAAVLDAVAERQGAFPTALGEAFTRAAARDWASVDEVAGHALGTAPDAREEGEPHINAGAGGASPRRSKGDL